MAAWPLGVPRAGRVRRSAADLRREPRGPRLDVFTEPLGRTHANPRRAALGVHGKKGVFYFSAMYGWIQYASFLFFSVVTSVDSSLIVT